VLGLEIVDENGDVLHTSVEETGYDLTGALVGSEGTLGIVCSAWVRLLRAPESVRVWLAGFPDVETASEAVSAIIGAGIVPTALEMMDRLSLQIVEAAFHAGYPTDAGAVLLVESAGFEDDLNLYEREIERIVRAAGATSWRAARSQAERDALWAGRKGALGATGRVAPNYYIQDVVVPRTKLPQALDAVETACDSRGIKVANVFHAGDGNLHPLLMYDRSDSKQVGAVIDAGNEILQAAVDLGGTISGEHGIGYEKRGTLTRIFSTDDLAAMARVREVFDPRRMLNPEKIFPAGVGCGEVK
jgi:glycolate oxidase